jgi:putative nucleotidyltransferase with HDIG domain
MKSNRHFIQEILSARGSLVLLLVFTALLGLMNWLVVNQMLLLYCFYLPVLLAAMSLVRRDAIGVSILAALMVVAYMFFMPTRAVGQPNRLLLWSELMVWGGILVVTAYLVATLRQRTLQALESLSRAYQGVLAILSRFIQTVDADTEAHCSRVSACSVRLAEELRLDDEKIEEARIAGLLHDVGKVDVSVELLRKAAALSDEEQARVSEHTTRGAAIVKPVGGMMCRIAEAIEAHHEKFDGTGLRALKGEAIPLLARIVAVADAFDALVSDRPYRKGMAAYEALDSVADSAGQHFDPKVVEALRAIVAAEGGEAILFAAGHESVAAHRRAQRGRARQASQLAEDHA